MSSTIAFRQERQHRGIIDTVVELPWMRIGFAFAFGAGTIICAIVAGQFLAVGTLFGVLMGLLYVGLTIVNGAFFVIYAM